ncbi:MAG: hypothetical protein B6242_02585 [Anaerolineaceae bacterium 4572_78]|nr:MAG: hypothetical protein B6242_02585 [Anaerolineaceae bacterium 4572_78]
MFTKKEEVITFIKKNHISMIDVRFVDLFGRWHHITLPAKSIDEVFSKGVGFDGSSIPGFKSVEAGDMIAIPDVETAHLDPFWNKPTLGMICSLHEADTKEPFASDPRTVAQRANDRMESIGVGDTILWGPEFEFHLFDKVCYSSKPHEQRYSVDTIEGEWHANEPGLGNTIPAQKGYHIIPPKDSSYNIRSEICELIEDMDIAIKYHHHEVGAESQVEIETELYPMMKMADAVTLIKYIVRMVANDHHKTATFMPKPLYERAGNGMHFHTAMYYIGGMLTHGRALLALTNPSTNSYKRLLPGFEAPTKMIFGAANRSAAIRIPKYATAPEDKRIEFRCPDAMCNPYLAMAAMLMAGLDGIENKIDPREHNMGPFDVNIANMPQEKIEQLISAPTTLEEALNALKNDHAFLLKGNVFSNQMIEAWIEAKYQEYRAVKDRPHPYELSLYYDL